MSTSWDPVEEEAQRVDVLGPCGQASGIHTRNETKVIGQSPGWSPRAKKSQAKTFQTLTSQNCSYVLPDVQLPVRICISQVQHVYVCVCVQGQGEQTRQGRGARWWRASVALRLASPLRSGTPTEHLTRWLAGIACHTHMKNSGEEGLSLLEPFSRKPLLTSFSYFSL